MAGVFTHFQTLNAISKALPESLRKTCELHPQHAHFGAVGPDYLYFWKNDWPPIGEPGAFVIRILDELRDVCHPFRGRKGVGKWDYFETRSVFYRIGNMPRFQVLTPSGAFHRFNTGNQVGIFVKINGNPVFASTGPCPQRPPAFVPLHTRAASTLALCPPRGARRPALCSQP